MEHIVQLARGGQLRAAARVCLTVWWCARGTGAACRISSLLQAAAGSIFSPPQLPWVERGREREGGKGWGWGGCLVAESWKSTCADTMVRGCCHMVEGPIFKKHRAFSLSYLSLCACLSPMQSSAVSGPTCSIFCKSWGFEVCPLQRPTKQLDDHEALCRGDCANKMCGSD